MLNSYIKGFDFYLISTSFFIQKVGRTLKFTFGILCLFLMGCAQQNHFAPVVEASFKQESKMSYYVVRKGDTVYSIAFRYGVDFKELLSINGLLEDGNIYPGQRLYLDPNQVPNLSASSQIKTPIKSTAVSTKNDQKIVSNTLVGESPSFTGKWIWPAKGAVTNTFRSNKGLHKGIDIQGILREPVLAAATGRVVYIGEGVRGYGKLIILKHSDTFLSAYAHNSQLLVNEVGQEVYQGQEIALMGSSGTESVKLHFQIRKNGTPIDPLKSLPKN